MSSLIISFFVCENKKRTLSICHKTNCPMLGSCVRAFVAIALPECRWLVFASKLILPLTSAHFIRNRCACILQCSLPELNDLDQSHRCHLRRSQSTHFPELMLHHEHSMHNITHNIHWQCMPVYLDLPPSTTHITCAHAYLSFGIFFSLFRFSSSSPAHCFSFPSFRVKFFLFLTGTLFRVHCVVRFKLQTGTG